MKPQFVALAGLALGAVAVGLIQQSNAANGRALGLTGWQTTAVVGLFGVLLTPLVMRELKR
jgi:hypothetical protein